MSTTAVIVEPELDETTKADLALLEESVVTGFTLADAIRLGCATSGQAKNIYVANDGSSCALGAAWLAAKQLGYIA